MRPERFYRSPNGRGTAFGQLGGKLTMHLDGEVVIVTGAAMGIGRDIARRFAAERAAVVLAEINEEAGQATVDEIASGWGGHS